MVGLQTRGDRCTWVTARIHDMLPVVMLGDIQDCLDTWLGEGPRAGIKRLLLAPDDRLGIGVAVEILLHLLPWEGVELLNTRDRRVGDLLLSTMLDQCRVDLSGTQDHALDVGGLGNRGAVLWVRDDPAELRLAGELLDGGTGDWVAEERLGEEDDKCYDMLVQCTQRKTLGRDSRFLNCLFICLRRMWNKLEGEVM